MASLLTQTTSTSCSSLALAAQQLVLVLVVVVNPPLEGTQSLPDDIIDTTIS